MPTVPLHQSPHLHGHVSSSSANISSTRLENPLPSFLRTPTGLALLEIQGTLHLPPSSPNEATSPVGKLIFPHYDPHDVTGSKAWMKTVHLYVGKHQRLTGEVQKLPKAVAVIRKREVEFGDVDGGRAGEDELEILEIVEWKVVFSSRPEPVGD